MPCHKLFLNLKWVVPQELKNLDIRKLPSQKYIGPSEKMSSEFVSMESNPTALIRFPWKRPQRNSTYTFTHIQKVSRICTKCCATMLWITMIHYWKNCYALCPASRRFLWKNSLTRLWTNHSLAWNSNCTHTLYFFVSSCFIYNSFSFKKNFITETAMSFTCS